MDLSKHLEKAREAVKRRNYPFAINLYSQLLGLQPDNGAARIDALLADKGADGLISLREAIWATNNTANLDASTPDTIDFAIGAVGSQQTILLTEALPALTDSVVLDAMTQGGGGIPVIL